MTGFSSFFPQPDKAKKNPDSVIKHSSFFMAHILVEPLFLTTANREYEKRAFSSGKQTHQGLERVFCIKFGAEP